MTSTPRDWHNSPPAHGAAMYPEPVQIELAVTADDETGARPPTIDDGSTWHVVRSVGATTLWRCISLKQ
jgi:hypothetical protein